MYKNKLLMILAVAIIFSINGAQITSAETSTTNNAKFTETSREDLIKMIERLQNQINELSKNTKGEVMRSQNPNAPQTLLPYPPKMGERFEFKQELKQGFQNDDVKKLQDFLAKDKAIYPEGLSTGFFGPKTGEALKKFQAKYALEVTGQMNAETKALLNKLMGSQINDLAARPGMLFDLKAQNKEMPKMDANKLKIEIEEKNSGYSKVEIEFEGSSTKFKRVFLLKTTNEGDLIEILSKKLGLSESDIKNAISSDSSDDDDDEDEDDDDSDED